MNKKLLSLVSLAAIPAAAVILASLADAQPTTTSHSLGAFGTSVISDQLMIPPPDGNAFPCHCGNPDNNGTRHHS
jgi:hypothetical protein